MKRLGILTLLLLSLTACAGGSGKVDYASGRSRQEAIERLNRQRREHNIPEFVKLGLPYKVTGQWYVPGYEKGYDEVGMASWYGPGFHGKSTANGETYDQQGLTAAHRSLPLPSMVRVTNLENGRTLIVRVNDRGPFSKSRIIDLSERGARILGVHGPGTAKVRVQYLDRESRELWALMKDKGEPTLAHHTLMERQHNRDLASATPVRPKETATALRDDGLVPDSPLPERGMAHSVTGLPAREPVLVAENPQPLVENDLAPPPAYAPEPPRSAPPPPEPASLEELHPSAGHSPPPLNQSLQGQYLQAGAFASRTNAEKLAEKLSDLGQVIISPSTRGSSTFYRVRVGPMTDSGMQQRVENQLLNMGLAAVPVKM